MTLSSLSAIRFGYGPGARAMPSGAEAILASLSAPDDLLRAFPMPSLDRALKIARADRDAQKAVARNEPGAETVKERTRQDLSSAQMSGLRQSLARVADSPAPFRERLMHFWADHFAVRVTQTRLSGLGPAYLDQAIRPNIAAQFGDLLKAAVLHPAMLVYLDQVASVGPGSALGRDRGQGLNENLAREVLELHTMGAEGSYTQADVTEFAELLTGLSFNINKGPLFLPRRAEPGAETVLGVAYGGAKPGRRDILAFLDDLALHPDTAHHVSTAIATHFLADRPDPGVIAEMETAWSRSDGNLMQVYSAMLDHPAAWATELGKAKRPFDFMASALVALGVAGSTVSNMPNKLLNQAFARPAQVMGQPFMAPPDPSGWSEEAAAWITPQGLAGRIHWAMSVPARLVDPLPDPRDFVLTVLGDMASERLVWAAAASETRDQGVGLVLSAPEFNRR
ncbi:DUF1800 domain-containing protein [Mesobaculum littorinae]|uniref:DUF1800 domain-containing protein n=1 Tax=Mesobaculum littorinae TaxID=2486419 RepID=A0A438AKI6_9RHOB|nr:DUF1800 domain-containing protein [Mesobaculum littorinae]RVV99154.1 DUF1800 domain-containing protein [Mesobaculum littorinae]